MSHKGRVSRGCQDRIASDIDAMHGLASEGVHLIRVERHRESNFPYPCKGDLAYPPEPGALHLHALPGGLIGMPLGAEGLVAIKPKWEKPNPDKTGVFDVLLDYDPLCIAGEWFIFGVGQVTSKSRWTCRDDGGPVKSGGRFIIFKDLGRAYYEATRIERRRPEDHPFPQELLEGQKQSSPAPEERQGLFIDPEKKRKKESRRRGVASARKREEKRFLEELLHELHSFQVNLILCHSDKIPKWTGWNVRWAGIDEVIDNVNEGGLTGWIPAKSNLCVVDVDDGNWEILAKEYPPICNYASRQADRRHLVYYRNRQILDSRFEWNGLEGTSNVRD